MRSRWDNSTPSPRRLSVDGEGSRERVRSDEHLDAILPVSDVRALHEEFAGRGARIIKPLEERPWGQRDFYVEDTDGYVLCFSEAL